MANAFKELPEGVLRDYYHYMRLAFPEKQKERDKRHYELHRDDRLRKNKQWYKDNAARVNERHRRDRLKHPERYKNYDRKRRDKKRVYAVKRRWQIPVVRLAESLRARIRGALRQNEKKGRGVELLGCSITDFKIYLESKFETGMSWDNYGRYPGWQIDHIVPCAIFDLSIPEHQRRCFHFSNLQPMWARQNISKGCRHSGQLQLT